MSEGDCSRQEMNTFFDRNIRVVSQIWICRRLVFSHLAFAVPVIAVFTKYDLFENSELDRFEKSQELELDFDDLELLAKPVIETELQRLCVTPLKSIAGKEDSPWEKVSSKETLFRARII